MNPLLPRQFFTPDVEAHVMPDGRLYLYGSNDLSGNMDYCSQEYRVYSTDDPALERWVDHGVSFRNAAATPGLPWNPAATLLAPDAAQRDGKYYLYVCANDQSEAVAQGDSPCGPFAGAKRIEGADGIDPAVFVDDDGQAYYLWGQFSLKGARLNADMTSLDPASITDGLLTEQEHGFHEGSSMRKINGRYYIVFTDISRGRATCLSYAVADQPLGPYRKGGVIIDNVYCDPETWNNHGSIECFQGRWFVFYHRSSQNSRFSRRVCVEPIAINPDGSIDEVVMTCNGASAPIDAFAPIDASIACRLKGNARALPTPGRPGEETLCHCGGGNWTEDWAEYRWLDFGKGASACALALRGQGTVSLMAPGRGRIGRERFSSPEGFATVTLKLHQPLQGIGAVWVLFDGQGIECATLRFVR